MCESSYPTAEITFDDEGGIEESDAYLFDNGRMREEFEVVLPPFRQRVLEIINEVRLEAEGMEPVRRSSASGPSYLSQAIAVCD